MISSTLDEATMTSPDSGDEAGETPTEAAARGPRRRRRQLDPEQQDLAARHVPLARSLAKPLKEAFPKAIEEFDSAALLALVEAAQSFDPERGVKFGTFARFRILGALRDVQRMLGERGFRKDMPNARTYRFVPGIAEAGLLMLTSREEPQETEVDAAEQVEHWLKSLPPRHADACRKLYLEFKTQSQVAAGLGLAKSRVSTLHAEALDILRDSPDVRAAAVDAGHKLSGERN